jgi:hypothetical protein
MAGAIGALLLQAGLLFLFLSSMPQVRQPVEAAQEMMLVFRRALPLPAPLPPPVPERQAPALTPVPSQPAPLFAPPPAVSAPPSFTAPDLGGFGETLNDCAPEIYYRLTQEEQARCPHPGEGMAQDDIQVGIGPKSHAQDAATWQEDWDEKHWTAGLCDPGMGLVALCQMHQAITEYERADDVRYRIARAKAEALRPPKPP